MQEDAHYPVHLLAQHEPGLAQRVQGFAAGFAAFAVRGIQHPPRAVIVDSRLGHGVEQIDDGFEQRAVIDPGLRLQGVATVIQPRGEQQRAEEYGGNQQELQPPPGASWVAQRRCPRL